jgi:anaerobic selenocysteine-containing dehydrogenase
MTTTHSVCNFCHVRCPMLVEVENDRVKSIVADDTHPFGGLACVKGRAAPELLDHPDRLLHPLKRVGPKTADASSPDDETMWQRVSWDEALDDIARRVLDARDTYGPDTIVFAKGTSSGTGMGDAERWLKRLSNLLGTPNTVGTVHLCNWPRDESTRYTFGAPMTPPDLERSGCFLLWGANPSATNIRMAEAIQQARKRGMKLVTVDPRRVGVATHSDVHLFVQPGTDGALALSLAHVLVERGWLDAEFVQRWTNAPFLVRQDTGRLLRWNELSVTSDERNHGGLPLREAVAALEGDEMAGYVVWSGEPYPLPPGGGGLGRGGEDPELDSTPTVQLATGESVQTATVFHLLRDLLEEYPPERAAEITGVPASDIRAAAEILAHNRPVAHFFWNGLAQHTSSAQNARAISVLYALLGDFDAPGGNMPPARPAVRDVQLNDLLDRSQLERRLGWNERPLGGPRTNASSAAYDLYRAITTGEPYRPRVLLAFGTNMVMANGGSREGRAALAQLDLMVAADYFLTPTAQLADYVLPATMFLESPGLQFGWAIPTQAQTHVQYRAPAVAPRGEARSDTDIVFDLARRLGLGDQFWEGDLSAAFDHELEPLGFSVEELRSQPHGIQTRDEVSAPTGYRYSQELRSEPGRARGFDTPSRRVELFSERFAAHGQDPLPRYEPPRWSPQRQPGLDAEYPFILTNAKMPQFCHGQHRALPSLRRARPHPDVELHPETAAQAGVSAGRWVAVETPEGAMRARVRLNAAIKPGVVVGQAGWWQPCPELDLPGYDPYAADGANVNGLVGNKWTDPISGSTPFRSARCRLRVLAG